MDGGGGNLKQLQVVLFLNTASLQVVRVPSCASSTPTSAGLLVTGSIAATYDMLARTITTISLLLLKFCFLSTHPEDTALVPTGMRSFLAKGVSVCSQQTFLPEPWLTVRGLADPLAGVALASFAA